jgi:hypothetical protein
MISVKDLEIRARNRLDDVLRTLVIGENHFPLRIRIALPDSRVLPSEMLADCEVLRSQSVEKLPHGYSIEWHNAVPVRIYFASKEDFFGYIGEEKAAENVIANAAAILAAFPDSKNWASHNLALLKRPPEIWKSAIAVAVYLRDNPFPSVFARQLPVAASTKFVEEERSLLTSFMEAVAPETLAGEGDTFEERAGLLAKASFVGVKFLDPAILPEMPVRNFETTLRELNGIGGRIEKCSSVIIVENAVTFMTLPEIEGTIAIMGQGNAVKRLGGLSWLKGKRLYYWGDIDADGFRILAEFRRYYENAKSILMDEETFEKYVDLRGDGGQSRELGTDPFMILTDAERSLFEKVLGNNLRLEQEKIPMADSCAVMRREISRG